jgi:hypothetical protein
MQLANILWKRHQAERASSQNIAPLGAETAPKQAKKRKFGIFKSTADA